MTEQILAIICYWPKKHLFQPKKKFCRHKLRARALISDLKHRFLVTCKEVKKSILTKTRKTKRFAFQSYQKLKGKILPLTAGKCLVGIGCILLAVFLLSPFYSKVYGNYANPVSILVTYSQLLTTIFAITVSITLLGIQYLAQRYTPRSIRQYFSDLFFVGFIGVYLFAISLSLLLISFSQLLPASLFVFPSFLLLLFCLFYLVAYPFNMVKRLQPSETLKRIDARVPKNLFKLVTENRFWSNRVSDSKKEPFIVLEQVIIQSIRNNDHLSYVKCLEYFTEITSGLIEKANKEYINKKDLDLLASRTDSILNLIYRFFEQVKTEVFQAKNGLFILGLLYRIEKIIIWLHSAKGIRALRHVYDLHEAIGRYSIKADFESLTEEYCRSIERLTKVEMKATEVEVSPFELHQTDYSRLTEAQKKELSFNTIMYEYFERRRLDNLVETIEQVSEKGFEFAVYLLLSLYSDIYDKVVELKNPRMLRFLTQRVTWSLNEAYKHASERNIHESHAVLGYLEYKVEKIKKLGLSDEYSEFLAKAFCELSLLNIEKDDYGAIHDLGVQGRVLVREYPSIALIILETLGKALEKVSKNKYFEKLSTQNIRTEIESIQKWNKSNHKAIKEKVDQLLENTNQQSTMP